MGAPNRIAPIQGSRTTEANLVGHEGILEQEDSHLSESAEWREISALSSLERSLSPEVEVEAERTSPKTTGGKRVQFGGYVEIDPSDPEIGKLPVDLDEEAWDSQARGTLQAAFKKAQKTNLAFQRVEQNLSVLTFAYKTIGKALAELQGLLTSQPKLDSERGALAEGESQIFANELPDIKAVQSSSELGTKARVLNKEYQKLEDKIKQTKLERDLLERRSRHASGLYNSLCKRYEGILAKKAEAFGVQTTYQKEPKSIFGKALGVFSSAKPLSLVSLNCGQLKEYWASLNSDTKRQYINQLTAEDILKLTYRLGLFEAAYIEELLDRVYQAGKGGSFMTQLAKTLSYDGPRDGDKSIPAFYPVKLMAILSSIKAKQWVGTLDQPLNTQPVYSGCSAKDSWDEKKMEQGIRDYYAFLGERLKKINAVNQQITMLRTQFSSLDESRPEDRAMIGGIEKQLVTYRKAMIDFLEKNGNLEFLAETVKDLLELYSSHGLLTEEVVGRILKRTFELFDPIPEGLTIQDIRDFLELLALERSSAFGQELLAILKQIDFEEPINNETLAATRYTTGLLSMSPERLLEFTSAFPPDLKTILQQQLWEDFFESSNSRAGDLITLEKLEMLQRAGFKVSLSDFATHFKEKAEREFMSGSVLDKILNSIKEYNANPDLSLNLENLREQPKVTTPELRRNLEILEGLKNPYAMPNDPAALKMMQQLDQVRIIYGDLMERSWNYIRLLWPRFGFSKLPKENTWKDLKRAFMEYSQEALGLKADSWSSLKRLVKEAKAKTQGDDFGPSASTIEKWRSFLNEIEILEQLYGSIETDAIQQALYQRDYPNLVFLADGFLKPLNEKIAEMQLCLTLRENPEVDNLTNFLSDRRADSKFEEAPKGLRAAQPLHVGDASYWIRREEELTNFFSFLPNAALREEAL